MLGHAVLVAPAGWVHTLYGFWTLKFRVPDALDKVTSILQSPEVPALVANVPVSVRLRE